MIDIPNTQYITINRHGVFIGGKHVTQYRGFQMIDIDEAKKDFANIRKLFGIEELHIGAFDTRGCVYAPGNPSGKSGLNSWCRAKFRDGSMGDWVFVSAFTSLQVCACNFVEDCTNAFCLEADLRFAVLKRNNGGNVVKVGKFRSIIEKIAQKVR